MNKQEMIETLSRRTRFTQRECQELVDSFLGVLAEEVAGGGYVSFQGFGSFRPWRQTARPGRNPHNGAPIPIRARTSLKFKPGLDLLRHLNGGGKGEGLEG